MNNFKKAKGEGMQRGIISRSATSLLPFLKYTISADYAIWSPHQSSCQNKLVISGNIENYALYNF